MAEAAKKLKTTALSGIDAICDYCRSVGLPASKVSVLQMIRDEYLPAKKLGGIWDSDSELIDKWRRNRLETEHYQGLDPVRPAQKSKVKK